MIILHISTTALWDTAALPPFIPILSVHLSVHKQAKPRHNEVKHQHDWQQYYMLFLYIFCTICSIFCVLVLSKTGIYTWIQSHEHLHHKFPFNEA